MATTASSLPDSPTLLQNYDVFLSFRGADTRKTFTGHLLAALERCGFRTFRDDTKLRRGDEIVPQLLNAIHQCRLSIVVFSRNYAASRWCLDELVSIMESRRTCKQIVLPVFYDVDPSTVRSQLGHYAVAFAEHQKHFKLGQLEKWRQALSDAANLSGWDLQAVANGHEAKFIERIVKEVANKLNRTSLSVADHPVGIEARVQKLGSLPVDEVYMQEELDEKDSLELFSLHAFNKEHLMKDYEKLSWDVVRYAKGLPLVLEILGSHLSRKIVSEWRNEVMKLKKIPHSDVQRKLRLSFDSLNMEQKHLFLDIACFFVGFKEYITINILEECDFFPVSGIEVLKRQCLVKIDKDGSLTMHDMIQDMGREIVRQESPREPGERSRLWHRKDILDVLRYNMATKAVECLSLDLTGASEGPVNTEAFSEMSRLRLLRLYDVRLTGAFKNISWRLIELRWIRCPLKCFPSTMYIDNLVLLDLSNSCRLKHVWRENKVLNKLKFLYLDHCNSLTKTPDFARATSIEVLSLVGCKNLLEVQKSIGYLTNLKLLLLKDCENLEKLPQSVFMLKSVESLDVSGCSKLVKLAGAEEGFQCKWGYFFYLRLLHRILHTKSLDFVRLTPAFIKGLSCIKRLYLADCNISYVPSEIGSLISLDYLDLSGNTFSCLPPTICCLAQLRRLLLKECKLLQSIPVLPENLRQLIAHDCNSLEKISIRPTWKRQGVNLSCCPKLLDSNLANDFKEDLLCCKELQGVDLFSVVVGGSKAPNWCDYRSMGSCLSLIVPRQPGLRQEVQGLMLSVVFDFHHEKYANTRFHRLVDLDIHNKTKGIMRNTNIHNKMKCRTWPDEWILEANFTNCEGHMWLVYFSSSWLDVELEGGDELELSILSGLCRVKEFGASVISFSHVGHVND